MIKERTRNSNLELFRIVVMLLIVAHHYVVNSGLIAVMDSNPLHPNAIFLRILGAWGKTGINCFVLITGYFMCKSQITVKKYAKLLLEIYLYRFIIYLIFVATGKETVTLTRILGVLSPVKGVNDGFTSCFLLFYLLIPFLNVLTNNMNTKQHFSLMSFCLFIYTILGTIPGMKVEMNYVSWFVVLYLIASYIRLYPLAIYENAKLWGWITLGCLGLGIASIVVITLIGQGEKSYFLLADSNKFLAVTTAVSSFLLFKNLNIGYNSVINKLGATTFGVLMIHANSNAMRQWLWTDLMNNVGMFESDWLVLHALGSTCIVFAVCAAIDLLRIRFVEKPFFQLWDKYSADVSAWYHRLEIKITKFLCIEE